MRKVINTKKLWSGTIHSLYIELIGHYDVEKLYVSESFSEKIKRKINKLFSIIIFKEDGQYKLVKQAQKKFEKKFR